MPRRPTCSSLAHSHQRVLCKVSLPHEALTRRPGISWHTTGDYEIVVHKSFSWRKPPTNLDWIHDIALEIYCFFSLWNFLCGLIKTRSWEALAHLSYTAYLGQCDYFCLKHWKLGTSCRFLWRQLLSHCRILLIGSKVAWDVLPSD